MSIECVLVTGGAGFIGSALSTKLVELDLPVIAIDLLHPQVHRTGSRSEFLHPDVMLMKNDICQVSTWDTFLSQYTPRYVIHLAAETGTSQSLTEATRHANVNVSGTTVMLDAFVRYAIRPKVVVLASSRAVYGEGLYRDPETGETFYPKPRTHTMLSHGLWTWTTASGRSMECIPHDSSIVMPRPISIYGATKLAQEHILGSWCAAFEVPLKVLRLQNVYGEGQSPYNSYTGIINIFHKLSRANAPIEVYEDGNIWRDFVHVDDVADSLMSALLLENNEAQCIDVGTGIVTTIFDAARVIADFHGAPEPIICGKFRDGDVRAAVADITEMKRILHVSPKVTLAEGMERVAKWLISRNHI